MIIDIILKLILVITFLIILIKSIDLILDRCDKK